MRVSINGASIDVPLAHDGERASNFSNVSAFLLLSAAHGWGTGESKGNSPVALREIPHRWPWPPVNSSPDALPVRQSTSSSRSWSTSGFGKGLLRRELLANEVLYTTLGRFAQVQCDDPAGQNQRNCAECRKRLQ